VLGGAIRVPGLDYVNYVVPGIFLEAVLIGGMTTALALAQDLQAGIVDRFRSLPMARPTYLAGRTLADVCRSVLALAFIIGLGLLVGFRFRPSFRISRPQSPSTPSGRSSKAAPPTTTCGRRPCGAPESSPSAAEEGSESAALGVPPAHADLLIRRYGRSPSGYRRTGSRGCLARQEGSSIRGPRTKSPPSGDLWHFRGEERHRRLGL
jgi:hypothetical protein